MHEQLFCENSMGSKDGDYDILYRGEMRDYIPPGRVMFIQRPKECGGGYWLGRALVEAKNCPSTLLQALSRLALTKKVEQVEANRP